MVSAIFFPKPTSDEEREEQAKTIATLIRVMHAENLYVSAYVRKDGSAEVEVRNGK